MPASCVGESSLVDVVRDNGQATADSRTVEADNLFLFEDVGELRVELQELFDAKRVTRAEFHRDDDPHTPDSAILRREVIPGRE